MESAFSSDFATVRVHTGAAAHDAASALDSRALTAGTDILFRAGEYLPGTQGGDRLLAHELAHVVQQAHGLPQGILDTGATDHLEKAAGLAADHASPAAEREAHGAAMIAVMGEPVPALSGQPSTIARQDDLDDLGTQPDASIPDSQASLPPTPAAPVALAEAAPPAGGRTVDTSSDAYLSGYNDGRAGYPAAPPSPLSPDAVDDYNEGYQNGAAEAENAQTSLPPAPAAPVASAGPTPPNVFFCSKPLALGVANHAFFRVGGAGPGNQTYELEHDDYGEHCPCGMQGIPCQNYPEDRDSTKATCVPAPSISATCLAQQYNAYPQGNYCALGPNSNTYARVTAEACGWTGGQPPGLGQAPRFPRSSSRCRDS